MLDGINGSCILIKRQTGRAEVERVGRKVVLVREAEGESTDDPQLSAREFRIAGWRLREGKDVVTHDRFRARHIDRIACKADSERRPRIPDIQIGSDRVDESLLLAQIVEQARGKTVSEIGRASCRER